MNTDKIYAEALVNEYAPKETKRSDHLLLVILGFSWH